MSRTSLRISLVFALLSSAVALPAEVLKADAFTQQNASLQVTFDRRQPGIAALSVDSLAKRAFRPSALVEQPASTSSYRVTAKDCWIRYALSSDPSHPVWQMALRGDTLTLRSLFRAAAPAQDLTLTFDPNLAHATLLGHVTPSGDVSLPAVLHLPGMGSLRIFATGIDSPALHYHAHRAPKAFVSVTFPAATAQHPSIEYTLQAAAIYPAIPGLASDDPRFDGLRRDFLDIFQQQAELHVLANHSASDPCAFTVYEYADMARYTPELVKGLTALDLIRETLDRYLAGFIAYGMPGFKGFDDTSGQTTGPYVFTDVYPSLLISAFDYADGAHDDPWLRKNYPGLRKWAETLLAENFDGSPFVEYPVSGNSGSWTEKVTVRPANWWDTIGFGHQDAYSNALAYRALRGMAVLADRAGQSVDATRFRRRARQIHDAYVATFMDPAEGVLAGWKSADGQLHNYDFPFVNGIAVRYGLLDDQQARQVMKHILAKMQTVGYTNFALGLPGNLVPIRRADYVDLDPRFGGPIKEDGSDGFQVYENGGATACFAYFTIAALYQLGEKEQADEMLMPMLDSFAKQGFSGRAANGMTYDWKDWHGGAHGYEGFLVDNYYALLAVLDRAQMIGSIPD
jgi:hypothetical protein